MARKRGPTGPALVRSFACLFAMQQHGDIVRSNAAPSHSSDGFENFQYHGLI